MKKIIRIVILLAVIGGGGAYYWWQLQQPKETGVLRLYGNIDVREARIGFNEAGRIDLMHKEEGDRVARGEVVARLEDALFKAELEAAKARLQSARSILEKLLAGSRPQEIKRARAELERLKALKEDADLTVKRLEKLALDRFAPRAQLDTARAEARALEAQIRAQEQTLSLLIEGPRKEDIAAQRAEVARAEAEVEAARTRLDYTRLESKVEGTVTARLQEPGNVVLAYTPVYAIALDEPVWARVYAPEPALGRLREGMRAVIRTDSGGRFEGWVGYISPVAEFTPKTVQTEELRTSLVYQVRVYASNPGRGLRQGMPVTVEIDLTQPLPAPQGKSDSSSANPQGSSKASQ